MAEFMQQYGTDAQVRSGADRVALACKASPARCAAARRAARSGATGGCTWQCASCRHQCSVISGTIFESTKLPLTRWFLAMHLLTQAKNNVSALELKRHLGVSYPTAWLVKHKLMEVMRLREDSRQLTGRVEIDDAYLGGEHSGGKTGRGSQNKVPFIALFHLRPVLLIGRSDVQGQQMSQGIDRRMHLGPFASLGAVVSRTVTRFRCGLDRATIQDHSAGLPLAPRILAQQHPQIVHHGLEAACSQPALHLLIHGCPRRKIVRHHAPVCAGAHQPAQRIEHGTQVVFPLFAVQANQR